MQNNEGDQEADEAWQAQRQGLVRTIDIALSQ